MERITGERKFKKKKIEKQNIGAHILLVKWLV
jgi:hypothetical protein